MLTNAKLGITEQRCLGCLRDQSQTIRFLKLFASTVSRIDAGAVLKKYRMKTGLSQMALAVKVGVTLPAVSGWERNLYRPRRPTAQRLDDEVGAGGAVLSAFGYAPLPSPAERAAAAADTDSRMKRLEELVASLSSELDDVRSKLSGA